MLPKPAEHANLSPADLGDAAWEDVLHAVDQTYAELVEYQERLETRNNELTALRHFLASILASISDYLVVVDRDGIIADTSASFSRALQTEIDTLVGRPIEEFFDGDARAQIMTTIAQVVQRRQEAAVEVDLTTPSGPDPVEIRVAPRLDRRRKSIGAVLTGRPLGELKRAYSELAESHDALKQTQTQLVRNEKLASLGRLLAGVAHELNNPISFVYANAHALEKYAARFETYFEQVQEGASRDELISLRQELKLDRELRNLRTAIDGARDGAERVRNIVEDLRRLSADGSGEVAPFDLAETARISANWIERGSKAKPQIGFFGLERCIAVGRQGHIQQVVMNLVQNAADAVAGTDAPEIRIALSREGDWAVLSISDNGPGVPPEIRQKIFDPFFTTKQVGQGTGLGLSISHKIVEEHGGALALCEQQGSGACFRLKLKSEDAA